jgi:hypothetical protein
MFLGSKIRGGWVNLGLSKPGTSLQVTKRKMVVSAGKNGKTMGARS